jgi:hypothetical protein
VSGIRTEGRVCTESVEGRISRERSLYMVTRRLRAVDVAGSDRTDLSIAIEEGGNSVAIF